MYIDRENFETWMERITEMLYAIEKKVDRLHTNKNCLDGEQLLDNQDLCLMLRISPQTLWRYRHKKILPYIIIQRRCYYRSTDVQALIRRLAGDKAELLINKNTKA